MKDAGARYLTQLARRALSPAEVRPRVASRFESTTPTELTLERLHEVPSTPAVMRAPESTLPEAPVLRHSRSPAASPAEPATPPRLLTTREVIERVSHHESASAPRLERETLVAPAMGMPTTVPLSRAPLPAQDMTERALPSAPLLVTPTSVQIPATSHPARSSPANDTPSARHVARVETHVAPLLVPSPAIAHSPMAAAHVSHEPAPPAPIEIVIGRIEIRSDSAAPAPRAPAAQVRSAASLEDYLRSREAPR